MSKHALKKELLTLDKQQLVDLVLDAYSARKEIKEYFEYFLNPDPEKLFEKFKLVIAKELDRAKRGIHSKARISFLRKQIKLFESFQPDAEWSLQLRLFIVAYAMLAEARLNFPTTLLEGIASIMTGTVDLADANGLFDHTLHRLENTLKDPGMGTLYFRNFLQLRLTDHIAQRRPSLTKP